jgi:hypothetical protein
MPTRYIEAAHAKMSAAKKALEACPAVQPIDMTEQRRLLRELSTATDEYVAAVDAYLAKTKSQNQLPAELSK